MKKTLKINRLTIRNLVDLSRVRGGGDTNLCGGSDACGTQLNCGTVIACLTGVKTVC